MTKDEQPWVLVEVKTSAQPGLSGHLAYFQRQLGASHAFQVCVDMPYVDKDVFSYHVPIIAGAHPLVSTNLENMLV